MYMRLAVSSRNHTQDTDASGARRDRLVVLTRHVSWSRSSTSFVSLPLADSICTLCNSVSCFDKHRIVCFRSL